MSRRGIAKCSTALACLTGSLIVQSLFPVALLPVSAKPMPAPSLQEAAGAQWIVVASYRDYVKPLYEPADGADGNNSPKILSFTHSDKFDYFEPPMAEFTVDKILKAPEKEDYKRIHEGDLIRVPYHFHDLSACEAPEKWKFSAGLMPRKGSRWILFLKGSDPHFGQSVYETYRGSFGRLPDTSGNLAKVKEKLPSESPRESMPKS